jgi:hypothetical protein
MTACSRWRDGLLMELLAQELRRLALASCASR